MNRPVVTRAEVAQARPLRSRRDGAGRRRGDRGGTERPRRRQPARRRRVAGRRARSAARARGAPSGAPSSPTPGTSTTCSAPSTRSAWRHPCCRRSTSSRTGCAGGVHRSRSPTPSDGDRAAVLAPDRRRDGPVARRLRRGRRRRVARPLRRVRADRRPAAHRDDVAVPSGARRVAARRSRSGPAGCSSSRAPACSRCDASRRSGSRGEGAALLLTGNALHSDVGVDTPPSGFLGWFLTCVGQQHGFPVPEGGAGRFTDAFVARLAAPRRHDPLQRAGHRASSSATAVPSR